MVSDTTSVRYKSVHYIEGLLLVFDWDLAGF